MTKIAEPTSWRHWCRFVGFVLRLGVSLPPGKEKPTLAACIAKVGRLCKREEQSSHARQHIAELENIGQTIRSRQAKLKKDISLLDNILAEEKLSEAHLRMLIEKIVIHETDEGISLDIQVKAPFRNHTDTYENGVLTATEIEEIIKAG